MNKLVVGIASYEQMKARSLNIASGKHKPGPEEPKVWFTSVESFAKVLSQKNMELLRMIAEYQPVSYQELAALSGRKVPSLSRTLKTMERHGLVQLKKGDRRKIIPQVLFSDIELRYSISGS